MNDQQHELSPEQKKFMADSLEIFKKPNLLTLINQEFDKDHFGDGPEKMFVFLSELSSQLPPLYRFSTALTGYVSEGKTNIWKTTSKHLPKSWYLDLTRATSATIEDDILDYNLLYFGEFEANKRLTETLKQMVEDGLSILKKDVKTDFKEAKHITQPRKVGIYSTTHDMTTPDLESRYSTVTITGSPAKYKMVNDQTKKIASNIDLEIQQLDRGTKRTWISAGLAQLESVDVVTVPYGTSIPIDNSQSRSMRDIKRFLNLIRVLTWLHQYNRYRLDYSGQSVLIATPEDLWNAMEIGSNIFAQSYSGVETRLKNVIDAYAKIKEEHPEQIHQFQRDGNLDTHMFPDLPWLNRSLIQQELNIHSRNTIKQHCKTLEERGIFKISWTANRTYVALNPDLPVNLPINYPLITRQQNELYKEISEKYNDYEKIIDGSLIGSLTGSLNTTIGRLTGKTDLFSLQNDLPISHFEKTHIDPPKKPKKQKIDGSKLTGTKKQTQFVPSEHKKWWLKNCNDDNEITSKQLTGYYAAKVIEDLHRSNLIEINRETGNYKKRDVIQ